MSATRGRRLASEALGTALLLAAVVGSGIMSERLAGGNVAIALLANSLATGSALVALIHAFGPVSGAHFNPIVTAALAARRVFPWREVPVYAAAQAAGAVAGVLVAHLMFDLPVLGASRQVRTGVAQWSGEVVATFGLLAVVFLVRKESAAAAVGGYITAAYWFTSSTSFANPAATLARAFTDTFAGIRPVDVAGFVAAQGIGAFLAVAGFAWLVPVSRETP